MKKGIISVLLFSLLLCGCSVSEERSWMAGQKALAEENYGDAAAFFQKAGSYEDAEQLLLYANAWQELESGNYAQAGSGFKALGDFKDSLLMVTYCRAREQDALARTAFSADDTDLAVSSAGEAFTLYSALPLFRDSDARADHMRESLYEKSSDWMNSSRYDAAASGFGSLGDWQDSVALHKYCQAAALEQQEVYIEAAELFSEIPDVLDSAARAETARASAYKQALQLKESGEFKAAADAFAVLAGYRDAREQRDGSLLLLVRTLLQSGSYAEALRQFVLLSDPSVFPVSEPDEVQKYETFLTSFLNVWMNAHADVMNAFFSCNLLQPYLIPGDELDLLIRAELTNEGMPQHYGFIFYGAEVTDLYSLDEGFTAARVQASSSCIGPDGRVSTEETLWVLLDSRPGTSVAAAVLPA